MEKDYVFKGLMFDVFSGPKDSNLMQRFPQLSLYPEFREAEKMQILKINDVIRYIVAVYDKRGLRVYEESIQKRKKIACEMVGWKNANGTIKSSAQDAMDGKNIAVNRMIIRYMKIHKNIKYTSLVALEESYFNLVAKMMDPEAIKSADHTLFKNLESDIEQRVTEFFSGDSSKSLYGDLIDEIEMDKLELRPEDIAKRIRDGVEIVDYNPYGTWKPDKMRLVTGNE